MENPGEPKTPKLEHRHGLQNTQTFQNEAFVARGRQDLSECHESSDTIAGEIENNMICFGAAHDAPVNAMTKIASLRRAHGVRVNQHQSQNKTCASKTVLHLLFGVSLPTVCVTRAGAGGGTPSDWKDAEA